MTSLNNRKLDRSHSSSEIDDDVRSMLRQAVGLAKYMGRGHVVDGLKAVLDGDLATLQEISDDSMTRYEQGLV